MFKRGNMHPVFKEKRTWGQRAADRATKSFGSWAFIISFILFLVVWIILNIIMIAFRWDPYPFILLNLCLSCLAAIQAPVILMSQNRENEKDRIKSHYDYKINRKAEREIAQVQKQLKTIENLIRKKKR